MHKNWDHQKNIYKLCLYKNEYINLKENNSISHRNPCPQILHLPSKYQKLLEATL